MRYILLAVLCMFSLGSSVMAQDELATYVAWMKDVGTTNGNLRKNLEAKDGAAAAADAKKLSEIFSEVHGYWEMKNVADAMKFAMDAQAGFAEAASLAESGDVEGAGQAVQKASANCQGCHQAHRERGPDGAWRIK